MLDDLLARAQQYAVKYDTEIITSPRLGDGNDGAVWQTVDNNAVKVFWRTDTFHRELACYQRLRERNVRRVKKFFVPGLIAFDTDLQVIEMDIVTEPYILDFGKAYVDFKPDYHEDAIESWNAQYSELWGEERWKYVKRLLASLTLDGIYYQDPTPRNISFGSFTDFD